MHSENFVGLQILAWRVPFGLTRCVLNLGSTRYHTNLTPFMCLQWLANLLSWWVCIYQLLANVSMLVTGNFFSAIFLWVCGLWCKLAEGFQGNSVIQACWRDLGESLLIELGCSLQVKNAVHCTDIPEDGEIEVQHIFKHLWVY
jgi:hypothetical protein